MPRPQSSQLRRDELLENVAINYVQDRGLYVAHRTFPIVPVGDSSGFYRTYSLGDLTRSKAAPRAPGTEAAVLSIGSTDTQYATVQQAIKDYVTDEDFGDDRGPIPIRDIRTMNVMQAHISRLEELWGSKYFTTGVWGTDLTGVASATPTFGTQFRQFDHTGCDPVNEILRVARVMGNSTGYRPNILTVTRDVFDSLLTNSAILDRVSGGGTSAAPAHVNEKILAELFGLDEVLVSQAVENSANEGATDDIDYMFTNRCLLSHRTSTPSKDMPSAGYTFLWDKPKNVTTPAQVQVFTYYRDELGREDIEARMHYDQRVTAGNLGIYMITPLGSP